MLEITRDPKRFVRDPLQQVLTPTLVVRRTCGALQAGRRGEAAAFHHADEAGHQRQQLVALIRVHREQVLCIRAGLSRQTRQ